MRSIFKDGERVRRDLEAFASEAGLGVVDELTTNNMRSVYVVCGNGERVKGGTYLSRAGVLLGHGRGTTDARGKKAKLLAELKRIARVASIKMREYFEDGARVRGDLQMFAGKLGLESMDALSTSNMQGVEVLCGNGERVKGGTYLNRAGIALGYAKNATEAQGKPAEILAELKRIAGG